MHDEGSQGLRAIAWVQPLEQLWIANEDLHRIIIVDKDGKLVIRIKIKNPIGLLYNHERNMVFVGAKKAKSNSGKGTGAIFGVDVHSKKIVKTFTLLGGTTMNHPTGRQKKCSTI
jgi:hypothetical protein